MIWWWRSHLSVWAKKHYFGIIVCVIIIMILIIFFAFVAALVLHNLAQSLPRSFNAIIIIITITPYSNGATGIGTVIWTKHCVKLFRLFLCKNLYNGIKIVIWVWYAPDLHSAHTQRIHYTEEKHQQCNPVLQLSQCQWTNEWKWIPIQWFVYLMLSMLPC